MIIAPHKILIPASNEYEDLEVWYPKLRLEAAGHKVILATPNGQDCVGKHGYPLKADAAIADVDTADLAGVMVPGGWSPDALRRIPRLLTICRELDEKSALCATICHGPWVFISAKIVKGRRVTSTPGIKDDLENAGALWRDEAVVVDGNMISSRRPPDLPEFGEAMVKWLASRK